MRSLILPICICFISYGLTHSQTIGFWRMDSTYEQDENIYVSDFTQGELRDKYDMLLTTGYSYNGTDLNSPTLTTGGLGVSGEALIFNESYALIRDIWRGYDSVIIDFWMNISELPSTSGAAISYIFRTGVWDLVIDSSDRLQWTARNSSGGSVGFVRQSLGGMENQWVHVVATFNSDISMSLSVNDVTQTTIASEMWWLRPSDHIQVGYLTGRGVDRAFKGMMDDIKISLLLKEPCVRLFDNGLTITVDNGIISFEIEKKRARIISLRKGTQELMGNGAITYHQRIAYDPANPPGHSHDAFTIPAYCDYSIIRDTPEIVEVSFVEKKADYYPFHFDSRFVLKKGESGYYNYVILEFDSSFFPRACLQQLNLAIRVDPEIFVIEQVADNRWHIMPTPNDVINAQTVMDATFLLPTESDYVQRYDDPVYTKYNMIVNHENHHVHGSCSKDAGYGVWVIQASAEYMNGAPATQELTVHQTNTTAFMLGNYQDVHFGSDKLVFGEDSGSWRKIFGPQFIYINEGAGREQMWEDAKAKADMHVDLWPYQWMEDQSYEIDRGAVQGRLNITDASSPANALIVLAQPQDDNTPHWQKQGKDYTFWARTDADGNFNIENVKPQTYTLYASVDGHLDEYRFDGVQVERNQITKVGILEWTPVKYGRSEWQIGIADRDSTEFRSGDDFRHWGGEMRDRYNQDFPDGVDFTVGVDDWATDWNYAHINTLGSQGVIKPTTWRINFNIDRQYKGMAYLRFGIAGSRSATLAVNLGRRQLANMPLIDGQGYPRSGSKGFYHEVVVPFDASYLILGNNSMALTQTSTGDEWRNIHYDCIRLELPYQADLNNDYKVNLKDFSIFAHGFKQQDINSDLNADEDIDTNDLILLAREWLQ